MKEKSKILIEYKKLISSAFFKFPKKGSVSATDVHGVYIIYDQNNIVLHVGKTSRGRKGLNQRLQQHINNQSSFSIQYLKRNGKILRKGYNFKYLEVENARKRALLESLTTGLLCPAHIGTGEKRID